MGGTAQDRRARPSAPEQPDAGPRGAAAPPGRGAGAHLAASGRRGARRGRALRAQHLRHPRDPGGLLRPPCRRRCDSRDVAELEAIKDAYERHLEPRGIAQRIRPNLRLHGLIYRLAGNEDALEIIDKHAVVTRLLTQKHNHSPARARQIAEQHRALIAAIAAHDVEAAGEIAGRHMRGASDALIERTRSETQQEGSPARTFGPGPFTAPGCSRSPTAGARPARAAPWRATYKNPSRRGSPPAASPRRDRPA